MSETEIRDVEMFFRALSMAVAADWSERNGMHAVVEVA